MSTSSEHPAFRSFSPSPSYSSPLPSPTPSPPFVHLPPPLPSFSHFLTSSVLQTLSHDPASTIVLLPTTCFIFPHTYLIRLLHALFPVCLPRFSPLRVRWRRWRRRGSDDVLYVYTSSLPCVRAAFDNLPFERRSRRSSGCSSRSSIQRSACFIPRLLGRSSTYGLPHLYDRVVRLSGLELELSLSIYPTVPTLPRVTRATALPPPPSPASFSLLIRWRTCWSAH
ncbi:hypothetical protein PYCCODRAFT_1204121 [Trametes coccinea BRFM310]|uniref:Uncharacterized protein n=1 Tax=Trametes coccinea (strain BRFM310) TaxID=1353009 RepID=A0A1Y2IAW8_TRAC3|nr:hypothetical protein PYCCODRAFT_1204121 [Trametes coccinea BRFM310]